MATETLRTYTFVLDHRPSRGDRGVLDREQERFASVVERLVDLFLHLRGGLSPSLGTDVWTRRVVSLGWFPVEGGLPPESHHVVVTDALTALREELTLAGLPAEEIETWVDDCGPALRARVRDDAVRVNRRSMCRTNLGEAASPDVCMGIIGLVCDTYFARLLSESRPGKGKGAVIEAIDNNYSIAAGHLFSRYFGTSPKTPWPDNSMLCAKGLELLDTGWVPTTPKALKDRLAEVSGMTTARIDAALGVGNACSLKRMLNRTEFPSNDGASIVRLVREQLTKRLETARKQIAAECGAVCRDWVTAAFATINVVPTKRAAVGPITAALSRVFGGHSQVMRSEAARAWTERQLAEVQARLDKEPTAVQRLEAFVRQRAEITGNYTVRAGALGKFSKKVEARLWAPESYSERLGEYQAWKDESGAEVDDLLYAFLLADGNRRCASIVEDFALAIKLVGDREHRLTATIAHTKHVWMQCGPQLWPATIESVDSTGITVAFGLWNGTKTTRLRWVSKRAIRELGLLNTGPFHAGRQCPRGRKAFPNGRPYIARGRVFEAPATKRKLKPVAGSEEVPQPGYELLFRDPPAMTLLTRRNGKWYMDLSVPLTPFPVVGKGVAGLNLGLTCPAAVAVFTPHESEVQPKSPDKEYVNLDGEVIAVETTEGLVRRSADGWWRLHHTANILKARPEDVRKASIAEILRMKRLVSNPPVRWPKNALRVMSLSVRAVRGRLRAHGDLAKVAHRLGNDVDGALSLWSTLARSGSVLESLWTQTFREIPSGELPPLFPESLRVRAAHEATREWQAQDVILGAEVEEIQRWVLPSERTGAGRHVGGISRDRVRLLEDLAGLTTSWEKRMRPEGRAPCGGPPSPFQERLRRRLEGLRRDVKRQTAAGVVADLVDASKLPCSTIVVPNFAMTLDARNPRASNRMSRALSPEGLCQELGQTASLHGLALRETTVSWTAQVDPVTGRPGLRCFEVAVEEFLFGRSRRERLRHEELAYLTAVRSCWDPATKVWSTPQGRWTRVANGWRGPAHRPPPVPVPNRTVGAVLFVPRGDHFATINADAAAAVNTALRWLAPSYWCCVPMADPRVKGPRDNFDEIVAFFREQQRDLLVRLLHYRFGRAAVDRYHQAILTRPHISLPSV